METTAKKKFSYFRLKLESYLKEHFPEMLRNNPFITARADEALTAYCDAVVQGFTHLEAESMASKVLFQGLHFSKYDTLVSVLENEFEKELPAPLSERLTPILLKNKAIQDVFSEYDLTDDFGASPEYEKLYTELTGTIVLLIEANNLPMIGDKDDKKL
ncbi:DUF1896 domain-containing protein [Bacteroides pyogenes]|uniref:DUF1896 domain-containing protein n=1 Tax=Bacteroides pyogenes TaxID=310300 RepID=UPI002A8030BA|nr:DUF1896 domain-containing protein [Bacteroides pyogenes]MDY4250567.1 DUF1896 domain-containing protein [Bacteroides pyogenes]